MSVELEKALSRTVLLVQEELFPDAPVDAILNSLTSTSIRLRADADALSTPAAQTAFVATFIACTELGADVVLDVPDLELVSAQPPLEGERLRTGVLTLGADLLRSATSDEREVDLELLLGGTNPAAGGAGERLRLSIDDWQCRLDRASEFPGVGAGIQPFGAVLGGAASAAEVFRVAMLRLAQESGRDLPDQHPIAAFAPVAAALPPIDAPTPADAIAVDFISAGAITHAALFTLARVPNLRLSCRVFDNDSAEVSNLNRYALLRAAHLGLPKPEVLKDALAQTTVSINPHNERFEGLVAERAMPLASFVAVGVDDIPSRWLVQRFEPDWLGVGSTAGLMALISEHEPAGPCVGCLHPQEDEREGEIATISFVSLTAGLLLAHRIVAAVAGAGRPSATIAYPLALMSPASMIPLPLSPNRACPVSCRAARLIEPSRSD